MTIAALVIGGIIGFFFGLIEEDGGGAPSAFGKSPAPRRHTPQGGIH